MKQHEVLIVGDGVIGLTLAIALAQHDIDVALLMRKSAVFPQGDKQKYDLRVSAITPASQRILQHIGVWPAIKQGRISPFRDMQVWDAAGTGKVHFDSAWLGQAHLGHIIENSVMTSALQERLADYPNIQPYYDFLPTDLLSADNSMVIRGEINLQANLIVGADGAQSWVRQQAGIALDRKAYGQTAIVCTVQTELPHQETARQRFLPNGPLAFLPLNQAHYCSIVWSCDTESAQALLQLEDAAFREQLAQAFEYRLGNIISCSSRVSFPLVMQHAKHYVMPQIALVGDAAHTIHPLAGQGMNMGLLDVAALVDTLLLAKQWKRPLGYIGMLRRYERERRTANTLLLQSIAGFKQLFGQTHPLLSMARNQGLKWTDQLPWLKNFFMQQAMGNYGSLPALAKPYHE